MNRIVLLLLLTFAPFARANSVILDTTSKSLEVETSSAASTDYVVSWVDNTTTTFTPGMSQGNITTATTTTVVAAPGASTQRQIKWISLRNRSTSTSQTVTIKLDVSATEYHLSSAVSLSPGETLQIDGEGKQAIFTVMGFEKQQAYLPTAYNGRIFGYAKNGTAKDAAGYAVANGKDAGFPGAYSLGAPGLNGVVTDCSLATSTSPAGATQMGAHPLVDASSGSLYLTSAYISDSVAEYVSLVDVLWYNTGLVVTTTTAQAITHPGIPARDVNGTSNGAGVGIALLTTTANTNAAVIANTTASYTDQDGNAGNTATFAGAVGWQAPATPVIGTWMPFTLAAGDTGVRSVQSVTLGTSYGGGALSLVQYRPLAIVPNPVANVGSSMMAEDLQQNPGVRIYNDSCIWTIQRGSASAGVLMGAYTIMER